ncbi:PQQ-binding-like beta-propeller repeat protein [Sphingobacterium paludis]|uniref:Outer membrane protein assembly factor BamB n=1 Tax=Sphingobacterium paludis TaxID=1476465 RepID=A0A4V3E270_9SPHI|nr:hypothetical protein [Sphingobacterium paludis]TDS16118.1 outer membrane protein assembly factor BamB [Sphingobacterium paludis]
MRNTIILTIVLFIAVIGASIYYFSDLHGEKKEVLRPLTFLPRETFLISTFHNDATTDNIFKDFEIFEALVGKAEMSQWKVWKDKLLRNTILQPYVNDADMYVSFHPEKEKIVSLITVPTAETIAPETLAALMEETAKTFKISEKDSLGARIYQFDKGVKDSIFHVVYHKNIFFASYSDSLIYKVIDNKQPKLGKKAIDYFVENNSRNSPLSVYFVHEQINAISTQLLRKKPGSFLQLFDSLGGQSAWNLNFKNDALILSGESETDKDLTHYLETFSHQAKTTQRLFNYFPENTASYLSFAVSNSGRFEADLKTMFERRGEWEKLSASFQDLERRSGMSMENDIRGIFGNEFAVLEQSNQTSIGFITLNDSSALSKNIDKIASEVGDSIFRFDYANIPYALFGDPLKSFSRPYFVRLGNTIALANSMSLLQNLRQDWRRENLLINTLGFKNFEKIQGNEANITYFQRTRTSATLLNNLLKPAFSRNFQNEDDFGYQDFYSWSAQISGNNGDFLSSIYAIYKSKNALGATPDWTYEFDNRPITAPWVFEHSDTSQFILIQEQDHRVHGIHPSGKKLWSAVFHGRVVGDAQQLADRSIVLVTDRNQLYRFDTHGNGFPGFSLHLSDEPTYTPTIAELDGQQLILIPAGKKLLVHAVDGKKVGDWEALTLAGKILFDVKVRDNFVYLGTDNGHFYKLDAKGNVISEETLDGSFFRSPIAVVDGENKSSAIVALDTTSTLVTIRFDQNPTKRKIGAWGNRALISLDGERTQTAKRLIAIAEKKLFVTGLPDGNPIFEYTFTQSVTDRPQIFKNTTFGDLIGISSRENTLLYLFDEKGNVIDGFPIEALPQFYFGKIDYNSATYLLCVRRDKKLYAFKN